MLQKVSIEQNLPAHLMPGESAVVKVTISKGKITGFAKFQLNVGPGLEVENILTKGASFTFNEQKAKFIWMSLPEESTIEMRYRITAKSDADGLQKIEGHFSYIDENERLVYELPEQFIATGDTEAIAGQNTSPGNSTATAFVHREIEPQPNGRFLVTLTIHKNDLSGFAKLQEDIPTDYTAAAVESDDAVFNIVDNKAKFVWFDIPSAPEVTLSYEMIPVIDEPDTGFNLHGEFSFLVNNETQTIIVGEIPGTRDLTANEEAIEEEIEEEIEEVVEEAPEEIAELSAPEVVEIEETETWESDSIEDETEVVVPEGAIANEPEAVEAPEEIAIPEPEPVSEITTPEPVAEINEPEPVPPVVSTMPETEITFKVQITAGHKLVDAAYFRERHNYSGPFGVENHEGWIKYTTGSHKAYRSARDQRNSLQSSYNFPGPFVTAYNEGERITVQEALMIANQKWVQ